MSRELTIKQRRFVKRLVSTGNGTQAALEVYDVTNKATAASIASENLTKPNVRSAVESSLRRSGLTLDFISETIKDSMVSGLGVKSKNSDSIRAAELLLKLHGAFPNKNSTRFQIDINEELKSMTFSELKIEFKKIVEKTQELLMDAGCSS